MDTMKLEWNHTMDDGRVLYNSILASEPNAWMIRDLLEDQGYAVGIESMSRSEIADYTGPHCFVVEQETA